MVELRKRAAPPPAPEPKAKKAATTKSKGKKDLAEKEEKPPASNPAKDATGGIPEGAGGVSSTAEITTAEDAQETAATVEAEAAKGVSKKGAKTGKGEPPKSGDSIDLEGFGAEIETNAGDKVTLAKLVEDSKAGVVLFTYPKASTPGCTLVSHNPLL